MPTSIPSNSITLEVAKPRERHFAPLPLTAALTLGDIVIAEIQAVGFSVFENLIKCHLHRPFGNPLVVVLNTSYSPHMSSRTGLEIERLLRLSPQLLIAAILPQKPTWEDLIQVLTSDNFLHERFRFWLEAVKGSARPESLAIVHRSIADRERRYDQQDATPARTVRRWLRDDRLPSLRYLSLLRKLLPGLIELQQRPTTTIEEVALRHAFASAGHFAKATKAVTGQSPTFLRSYVGIEPILIHAGLSDSTQFGQ